jgi:transposase InsO family protein
VGWRKSESTFEFWVADAHNRNTLVSRPVKSLSVASIVGVLEGAIRDFGLPWAIRTDLGTEFTNGEFRRFLASHGIAHEMTVPTPAVRGLA